MPENISLQTYNLKVIVQETGLKPETLRAWERRYGLPRPHRSQGGHRLYSNRDIEIVKWLMARQGEGLSISNAVDLWNTLEKQGQDPLQMPGYSHPPTTTLPAEIGAIENLRDSWVAACKDFDEQRAERVLAQAFALYPPETVCIDLIGKGLTQFGDGWYAGEITVQQEHFASELAMRRLESLIAAAPQPTRPGRILVAAPPEEQHDFILLVITLLLRRRGLDVVYLGSNVPLHNLEDAIQKTQPRIVVSAAQQLHTAARLLEMAKFLQKISIPVAYGGRVFNLTPGLRKRIPGYYLGDDLGEAPEVIEAKLVVSNHMPPVEQASKDYEQALEHFRKHLPAIEARTWQTLGGKIAHSHLATATMSLSRDIEAALVLGDMAYLGNEIQWVDGLLVNHEIPRQVLRNYLSVYRQAALEYLDERGAPVLAWLEMVSQATER
jgi:DNA-binding transcriptional MerR regulator/methylmalonyl-CoA mutase cobalamin-binding subunit